MQRRQFQPEDLDQIRRAPLLSELPQHLIDALLSDGIVHRYLPGEMLFRQGETPEFLHIVLGGEIGLYCVGNDGGETMMEIMKAGECFIAAAVLTDLPYLMGAKALLPSRVMLLPADRLRRDLLTIPDLALAMLTSLSIHFRKLVREAKALKLKSPTQRLGLYLLSLTNKREGSVALWLPHSKGVIAARIGVRQETLSRALAQLRQCGVTTTGAQVTVSNIAALSAFCHLDEDVL
ncbi:cyclic nucleotide-binding domain-containing protein [Magnetospirillum sp. 15-1]|uniref:cyclic nucleotide-binding domain-containing protein n=1 Tax=Magnetospirillum sp. 15-1 TaxID=1979370 RepID=UPI000BBBBB60|nr:cyclic nucleotide-binding domain-containing protein [Magnetospirillum sp. 15-1]